MLARVFNLDLGPGRDVSGDEPGSVECESGDTHTDTNVCCSCAGVPVSSRVSAKIQQLVNTLKRPKRPPLREFFVDDFEELLEGNGRRFFLFPVLILCQNTLQNTLINDI